MERDIVNPWEWQKNLSFVQGNHLKGVTEWLVCAGQTSAAEDGAAQFPGDMEGQIRQCFRNVETVLAAKGFTLADVVRMTYYTTDIDKFFEGMAPVRAELRERGYRPTATLLGVTRLADPEMLVEIEATAAR